MPIGVPKVPYWIPGDEEATWVDLYNVMYRVPQNEAHQNAKSKTTIRLLIK
jgi:hypothetical protein